MAPQAPGQIMFTALPASFDGTSKLYVSVVVTPQLVSDDPAATMASFPLFQGDGSATGLPWPAVARALQLYVQFPGATYSYGATPLAANLNPALWPLIFSPTLLAEQFSYDAATTVQTQVQQNTRSYSVVHNFNHVVGVYRPPWHPPGTPPAEPIVAGTPNTAAPYSAARVALSPVTLAHFAHLVPKTEADRLAARALVRQLRAEHGVVTPQHIEQRASQDGRFTPEVLHFAEAQDYYADLAAGAQARYAASQNGTQPLTPTPFDFHSALTVVSRYPALMRALGLILDFELDLDPSLPPRIAAASTLSVNVSNSSLLSGYQLVYPTTPYALSLTEGSFVLAPSTTMPELATGYFMVPPDYALPYSLRLDALMQELPNAVAAFQQRVERAANSNAAAPVTATPAPALTTSGLSLARSGNNGLIMALTNMINAQAGLSTSDTPTAPLLTPESVIRGFRVDIQVAGQTTWQTLHARDGSYTFSSGSTVEQWTDEGWVTLQAFNAGLDGPDASLWTHETIFLWQGWSLSAPRPGLISDSSGNLISQDDPQIGGSNLGLSVAFKAHPGSLPLLRLGTAYNCRLRAVDLAGGSLPLTASVDPAYVTSLGTFLRFDPLKPPMLLPRDPRQPGDSAAIIVLRSDFDTPPVTNAERLVAPPACSLQLAEWHGALDSNGSLNANLFADPTFRKRVNGRFSSVPYGDTPPAVPYLPDPAATSILLDFTPDTTDPTSPVTRVALDGAWPAINPYRLVLQEGAFSVDVDPVAHTITVNMPKAAVYQVNLVSGLNDAPASGAPVGIALFDYWNSAANGGVSPNDLPGLHTAILNGRAPQISPPLQLQLIHAVQRPLIVSTFADGVTVRRETGSGYAVVVGTAAIDGPSTAKADLMASWSEWVDDGINAPYQNNFQAHVASQTFLPTDTSWDSQWETDPPQHWMQHEFHDTRARQVQYMLVTTTRFREFFPVTVTSDPANITQTSAPLTLNVPCSSNPPAPKVLYVIPTFGWTTATNDDGSLTRQRSCGLRVYLDRPWYASGDGEQLGVVIPVGIPPAPPDGGGDGDGNGNGKGGVHHPPFGGGGGGGKGGPVAQAERAAAPADETTPPPMPAPLPPVAVSASVEPYFTQWGLDGAALSSGSLPQQYAPMPQHFLNGQLAYMNTWSFKDPIFGTDQPAVISFPVQFDPPDPANPSAPADPNTSPNNGRWYADIELDTGGAYLPFIRLALIRYQSLNTSQSECSCSNVVLADFVQSLAGRSASIAFDPDTPTQITLAISGVYNVFSVNIVDPNGNREGTSLFAHIEVDYGSDANSLWIAGEAQQLSQIGNLNGIGTWSATMTLPFARGAQPMRVVVLEYETWPTDDPSRNAASTPYQTGRLMYADTLPL